MSGPKRPGVRSAVAAPEPAGGGVTEPARPASLDAGAAALAVPCIHVVGIGDDGPAGLGPAARARVEAATLLCGGERHLTFFADHPADAIELVRAARKLRSGSTSATM